MPVFKKDGEILDTIIIGAGVAGLGCARKLQENNKEFFVITENIGGKIETSPDGTVNYGAYFLLDNYHYILPYVRKKERLHLFALEFHGGKKSYHLLRILRYPIEALRLFILLYRFKYQYENFKKQCETKSQKQVIEGNAYLTRLYTQTAAEFVKEEKIYRIAKQILAEGIYMCTFLPLSKVSAFDFLHLCLGFIIPVYEFEFLKEKITASFVDRILFDSVVSITKGEIHTVETQSGQRYRARHLVVATPPHVSKKLLSIKKVKEPASAYVFHIAGTLKTTWQKGQFELFNNDFSVIFIRKQSDGTYIFYSKSEHPNLEQYFTKPRIIFKKYWNPAFNIIGDELWECEQAKNLYVIGDYNTVGMEDAYITGIYAANRILKK